MNKEITTENIGRYLIPEMVESAIKDISIGVEVTPWDLDGISNWVYASQPAIKEEFGRVLTDEEQKSVCDWMLDTVNYLPESVNAYNTVDFEGETYVLLEQAYIDNFVLNVEPGAAYRASAAKLNSFFDVDDYGDQIQYHVYWEIMEGAEKYEPEDQCDWDAPHSVEKI